MTYYRDDYEHDRREADLARARTEIAQWEAGLVWEDCGFCQGKGEVPVRDGTIVTALAVCGYCRNGKIVSERR